MYETSYTFENIHMKLHTILIFDKNMADLECMKLHTLATKNV